jgi:hypothetical protein
MLAAGLLAPASNATAETGTDSRSRSLDMAGMVAPGTDIDRVIQRVITQLSSVRLMFLRPELACLAILTAESRRGSRDAAKRTSMR